MLKILANGKPPYAIKFNYASKESAACPGCSFCKIPF